MNPPRIQEIGEQRLLQIIRRQGTRSAPGLLAGIGDDGAVFQSDPQKATVISCDLLTEGVHFQRRWISPGQLGHKSLAVNLSDIAAMGATPRFALVGLALPRELPLSWVQEFYRGMRFLAKRHHLAIIGGDTCAAKENITISLTLLGEGEKEKLLLRSGAKAGDKILVTGVLGEAAAGLEILQSDSRRPADEALIKKQLEPQPRCREGQAIAALGLASAMMDISDGLAQDILNLTQSSGVGAEIRRERLPISEYLQQRAPQLGKQAWELALSGGEDYELLLSAPATAIEPLRRALAACRCPLTVIGRITPRRQGVKLRDESGRSLPWPQGYRHFSTD